MKPLCICGCRREAHATWTHPTLGTFRFAALCSIRLGPALVSQGWAIEVNVPELANAN